MSADEAAADGIKWTFNPMVDISRDPRWGRVVEGAGEDPFLGSAIAAAKVQGYQGNNFSAPDKLAATIKHFGGLRRPRRRPRIQHGRHVDPAAVQRLPAAVQGGGRRRRGDRDELVQLAQRGARTPPTRTCSRTILRDEWGFGGTTLSDYQAVQELEDFGYASDGADAARLALTAGVNIEMAVTIDLEPTRSTPPTTTYGPHAAAARARSRWRS